MSDFEMKPVTSSMVNAVGYDAETATLRVEFRNGSQHDYSGVPSNVWDSMNEDGVSVGAFINTEIKPVYPVERVN